MVDGGDPHALTQMRRSVLDSLIDQELAAQAAEEGKLDRTPTVVQAIEAARREVLAHAWIDQLTTTLPKAGDADVSRYYADHPQLFAQRHVYNVQQLVVPAPDAALPKQVREQIDANVPLQHIGQWLEEKKIHYSAASGTRAAEQMPLDILTEIGKGKDGQTLLIEQPRAIAIIHIVSSELQVVGEADAAPRIRKFLANRTLTDAIAAEAKRLKQNASIVYMGEFAPLVPDPSPQGRGSSGGMVATSGAGAEKVAGPQ